MSLNFQFCLEDIALQCYSGLCLTPSQISHQFSSVASDSLQPHGLQHTRLPCPSPIPGTYSNSCPSSRWCHPTISSSVVPFSCLQSFPVSGSFSVLHIRWPEYWSFSFSINPSNEYSGLISFRLDCFDLLAVQGTLKSLLQHHSSKASILRHSAFFMVQFSHPYMTTRKTIALRILEWVPISFSRGSSPPKGSNLGLLCCRQILYQLSHQGSLTNTWLVRPLSVK